jgi:hypothetical protein
MGVRPAAEVLGQRLSCDIGGGGASASRRSHARIQFSTGPSHMIG